MVSISHFCQPCRHLQTAESTAPLPQPCQQRPPSPPGWGTSQLKQQQHQQESQHKPERQAETSRSAPAVCQQQQLQQQDQRWQAGPLLQAPAVAAACQQQQSQGEEAEQMFPSQPKHVAEAVT